MRGERARCGLGTTLYRIIILALLIALIISSIPSAIAFPFGNTLKDVLMDRMHGEKIQSRPILNPSSPPLIHLKTATFDPLREEPRLDREWLYNSENAYHLVQCLGPIQSHWSEEIRATGAFRLGYIPDYTYIMSMDDNAKKALENLPFIRWIGTYHPAYKIQNGLSEKGGDIELNVLVFKDKEENLFKVIDELRALGGIITYDGRDNSIIRTKIDASKIRDIAFIPEVEWVEEYTPPRAFMNIVRNFTGADSVHAGGFDGTGIIGEVREGGFQEDHPDFVGQVLTTVSPSPLGPIGDDAHGTCTFGIIFSSGANDVNAKGMLPGGQGILANWSLTTSYTVADLANRGGVFQSNSFGGTPDSTYDAFSQEDDGAVLQYDVVLLYAAGNEGWSTYTCSPDAVAKNVIGVGALFHYDSANRATHEWTDVWGPPPAQGPAADGRIKPDLAGPYDSTYTTDSVDGDGEDGYAAGNYYDSMGGTSCATPVVAGAVGLVYQMYKENHFGNNPIGALPHASTVKAILIADAYQYEFPKANRYQQGWGGVDIGNVHSIGENHFIVDESKPLNTSESAFYSIEPTGGGPLKISLVWTDVPGVTSSSQHLINNLDLKVTDPDGVVYWGNYGLTSSKWSSSGGSPDTLNNVENVFIASPKSGIWGVEVIGNNIPADGYSATPWDDQVFALVASNALEKIVVDITQPSSGNLIKDINTTRGTSSMGTKKVEVKIDDDSWETATGTTDWTYVWDTRLYEDGTHTIYARAFNDLGYSNVDSVVVTVDNNPPITSLNMTATKYFNGTKWFVLPWPQFTLSAIDNGSGVNTTWYRILYEDGPCKDWTKSNSFSLPKDDPGNYTVEFYSDDKIENREDTNSIIVCVDPIPPSTEMDISSPKYSANGNDPWFVKTTTAITLLPFDGYSGVNFTWYTIDGVYFEGEAFTFNGYNDGAHVVTWGSVDNLGNNESGHLNTIYVDSFPPSTGMDIGLPKYRSGDNDTWNVTKTTQFNLLAFDQYAGVETTWYSIDGIFVEGSEFNLTDYSDGKHTITWRSVDNLGHIEIEHSEIVNLDSQAPITEMVIGEPKYRDKIDDSWNVTSTTPFILNPSDTYTDINLTWYTIDGIYFEGTSFNLVDFAEGYHTITWGSEDSLGNSEIGDPILVCLDTSPPITELSFDLPKYRDSESDYWNVTSSTGFSLSRSDLRSGTHKTWYTIDGNYFEGTFFTLFGYNDGTHHITWGSVDKLGLNETGNSITVILDTTSPETSIDIGSPKHRADPEDYWAVNGTTMFSLTSLDEYSGVNFTWYKIDGVHFVGSSFYLSGYNNGLHNIAWGSEDNLGNDITYNAIRILLDDTPPVTTIEIGTPQHVSEDIIYINTTTRIDLFADDGPGSGVFTIWYSLDGGGSYETYTGPFTVPLGTSSIMYGAQDFVHNNATPEFLTIVVDGIDIDMDGIPSFIDDDDDGDGIPDENDAHPLDSDNDGIENTVDTDDDGDGISDEEDLYPLDTNNDGKRNDEDKDDDSDGLLDIEEDVNQNGVVDLGETDPLNQDTDGDGYNDAVDAYPLDKNRWEQESDITALLLMICVVVVIGLILLFLFIWKREEQSKAEFEWMDLGETTESSKDDVKWLKEEFEEEKEKAPVMSEEPECSACGAKMPSGVFLCPACGALKPPPSLQPQTEEKEEPAEDEKMEEEHPKEEEVEFELDESQIDGMDDEEVEFEIHEE